MSRLRIAIFAIAVAAGFAAPAAARTAVTTNITTWTSSASGTPADSPYLMSYDNQQTTLAVSGTASGAATGAPLDLVCYHGSPSQAKVVDNNPSLTVKAGGTFSTGNSPPQLRLIAGLACRLRAIPRGTESDPNSDSNSFAGPAVAVSETALLTTIPDGPNQNTPYNFYVNGVTFSGFAAWKASGTPADRTFGTGACGGPYAAPVDSAFDIGGADGKNYPVDCVGSLLSDDLRTWGGRSEIMIDGNNAYDAASAQALIPRTSGGVGTGSEDLAGFPKTLNVSVVFDPSSGLISSRSVESLVRCDGTDPYLPASVAQCPKFDDTGVVLTRVETTSDGGRVITLTDTFTSTDGRSHTLDLLYDDYAGVVGHSDDERGWQLPGQGGFAQYATGASVPAPSAAPGSILLRTNVSAADGDPNEGFGAITFGQAQAGLRFAGPSELEEDQLLSVPAGGGASLSYVYSIATSQADINALALTAQDRFQPASLQITSPADGTTVSTSTVSLSGIATAGSGITSLLVGGQAIPVAPGGAWSAQVPLSPGPNTITALATDGAGATAQAQMTVVYQPPATPAAVVTCHVPRLKGMKLAAAEKALRKAHCKVGKVKHVSSRKLARGRVMSTKPRAGRRLQAGAKIELFVSSY